MGQIGNYIASHELSNGVKVEIREVPGFGRRSEIGFFIEGACVGTFVIDQKRSGNIEVKPSMMRAQRIRPKDKAEPLPATPPQLNDIVNQTDNKKSK